MRLAIAGIITEYEVKEKLYSFLGMILNVVVTGVIMEYVFKHRNFISYGLAAALFCYYFQWLVREVKRRPGD